MSRRSVFRVVCAIGALVACSLPAAGQTNAVEQPLLGSVWTLDQLRDLPTSNNPLSIVEAAQPEAIADRFTAGGLNAATPPRFGGFLGSWTQTEYRVGDVSVTDPRTGGAPLLLPILPFWDRLTIATGAMGPEENAPALSVTLDPRRSGAGWSREFEGWGSGSGLVAGVSGPVPAADRVDRWQDWSAVVSGPLTPELGLAAGGAWRKLAHIESPGSDTSTDSVASGLAHLVYSATPRDEVRVLGWVQHISAGSLTDTAVHAQSVWEHRDPQASVWRVFGGYTGSSRTSPASPTVTVDSLTSDPVSNLFDSGGGTARRWAAGARLAPQASQISTLLGVDAGGADMNQTPTGILQIRELVDGLPARVWSLQQPAASDARHMTTISAFGNEHLSISGVTIDAGLRLEHLTAAADAAAEGVSWTNWLPSAAVRWQVVQSQGVALSASYRRNAYQLPLNLLAIGDPAATVADVSSWNGRTVGPAIARVGPGTGGDVAFSRLDPGLERPTTDELVLAVEWQPTRTLHLELARITKREEPLIILTDPGVPASSYDAVQVPDPSFQPFNQIGSPFVTAYNRPPGAYGRDSYLLTNRPDDFARFWAVQFTVRATAERYSMLAGAGLTEAEGPAAAIGFLPTENDQDLPGSAFVDPNSATAARGQLFQDRSHVVKLAGIYRFHGDVHFGVIARYQDGQPFARIVVAPGLTQGPTQVRAYANGGSAFTYIGTLDMRLQKSFTLGHARLDAGVDVYNLANLSNEVAEYVVSGPSFRTPTAVQPPLTVLGGVRVTF